MTAWLSNLFNTDMVLCFHEIMRLYPLGDLRAALDAVGLAYGKEYVGVSEPAPMAVLGLRDFFPDDPLVVVKREPKEAASAVRAAFSLGASCDKYIEVNAEALKRLTGLPMTMTVDFDELGDIKRIKDIWEFLVSNVPFDFARVKLLKGLNVTVGYRDLAGAVSYVKSQVSVIDMAVKEHAEKVA